jgi:hypothetical protein
MKCKLLLFHSWHHLKRNKNFRRITQSSSFALERVLSKPPAVEKSSSSGFQMYGAECRKQ